MPFKGSSLGYVGQKRDNEPTDPKLEKYYSSRSPSGGEALALLPTGVFFFGRNVFAVLLERSVGRGLAIREND